MDFAQSINLSIIENQKLSLLHKIRINFVVAYFGIMIRLMVIILLASGGWFWGVGGWVGCIFVRDSNCCSCINYSATLFNQLGKAWIHLSVLTSEAQFKNDNLKW